MSEKLLSLSQFYNLRRLKNLLNQIFYLLNPCDSVRVMGINFVLIIGNWDEERVSNLSDGISSIINKFVHILTLLVTNKT